ncbi:hypothetical protein JAO29_19620 [Edaphobacter sp. HDX4]
MDSSLVKKNSRTATLVVALSFLWMMMGQSRSDVHAEVRVTSQEDSHRQLPSAVHYVGPRGNDSYEGTVSRAWATLQHADAVAKPGDLVIILDGIYRGDIILKSSGTPGHPITYRAENKRRAKIVGIGSGAGSAVIGLSGGYTVIQDLDVTGTDANGIILAYSGSIANHNQAIGNYVHGFVVPCNSDSGTAIESGAGDNYIGISHNDMIGNLVVNITPYGGCPGGHQASGLFAQTPYSVIADNIVINAGYGIQCWHAARNVAIVGNTLIDNLRSITVGAGDAPHGVINDYTLVQHNIIVHSKSLAIAETGKTGKHNRYIDNLIYGGNTTIDLNNELIARGTVNADPQFINNTGTATGNYSLQANSPARWDHVPVDALRAVIGADNVGHTTAVAIRPAAGIRADTASVRRGQSVILSWTTKNAVSAYLNGEPVPLAAP